MHPQLTDRNILCKEFIQALEECHAKSWARFTGQCNDAKIQLNLCLRKERLERTAKNREDSKLRKAKVQKALAEYKDDL